MAHTTPGTPEDLQARIDELEKADHAKDQFLALLSHELRNHIHAIRTNAWLVKARAKDPELARPTDAIDRQVIKLSKLVEDLLDVIRVAQKSNLAFEDVSVQQVVSAAVATAQSTSNAHRRELMVAVPDEALCVHGDAARLQQAIGNVIQNAIKYSSQQGNIRVRVFEDHGHVLISVKDQGAGIDAKDIPGIFNLYTEGRADRKPNAEGLGIGLHVAREVIEAHGGTIEAKSEGVGKGSEFNIRLPLVASRPRTMQRPEATNGAASPLSILVVDDNHDAADTLGAMLVFLGYEVRVVYDSESGLDEAAWFQPDVAVWDISLPGVNGYEAARRLRAMRDGDRVMLIALSGHGTPADALSAGFDSHLRKPVDVNALLTEMGGP